MTGVLVDPPSDWNAQLDALYNALEDPDGLWTSPFLDPVTLAFDASSWCKEAQRRDEQGKQDRRHMLDELISSLDMCGPNVSQESSTESALVRSIIELADGSSGPIVAGYLEKMSSAEVAVSAWNDLVAAAADLPENLERSLVFRRNVLVRILKEMAFDLGFGGDGSIATGVLANSTTAIVRALEHAGRTSEADAISIELRADHGYIASFTKDERINLVGEFFGSRREAGSSVVWLQLIDAYLDNHNPVRVGPVVFHDGAVLVQRLNMENRDDRVPEELWRARDEVRYWLPPNEEGYVLARVEVEGHYSRCVDDAGQLLEAILALYKTSGEDGWRRTTGAAQFISGKLRGIRLKEARATPDPSPRRIEMNRSLGILLATEAARFIPQDLALSADLLKASRAARQLRGELIGEASEKVVSAVRVLEELRRDAFPEDSDWARVTTRVLKSHWSLTRAYGDVENATYGVCSEEAERWLVDDGSRDSYRLIWTGLLNRVYARDPQLTVVEVATIGKQLFGMLQPQWLPAARLKAALQLVSDNGNVSRRPINRWRRSFDLYLSRLGRIRNSLQHGRVVDQVSVENVSEFAYDAGQNAVVVRAESAIRGEDLIASALQRGNVADEKVALLRGADWRSALAGETRD